MIIADKKRAATIILSKMFKDGGMSESEVKPEGGEHDEYSAFAEDMLAAIQGGSVAGLAKALKGFHDMIKGADEEQDQEG